MSEAILTGPDATAAIQTYTRIGAINARFDRDRVAAAIRTKAGRQKLDDAICATRLMIRSALVRLLVPRSARRTATPRRRRALRTLCKPLSASGRPEPSRPRSEATSGPHTRPPRASRGA